MNKHPIAEDVIHAEEEEEKEDDGDSLSFLPRVKSDTGRFGKRLVRESPLVEGIRFF